MPSMAYLQVGALDLFALAFFLACWIGYGWVADRGAHSKRGLVGVSHEYRLEWARQVMKRDMRVADAALVGNLMNTVSFYANTTIYITAGMVAVLGTLDKVIPLTEGLPFAKEAPRALWELKLLLMLVIFIVAYFKFTWSIRLFNLLSILIGAAPPLDTPAPEHERHARRMAEVNNQAGDEFNRGIRAYYFGLAAFTWVVQPWIFMATTAVIVFVLYRRDYASPALAALRNPSGTGR